MKTLRIQLVRSPIGAKPRLRKTVTALGLRRINASVVLEANPAVEGMVRTVSHLLEVEEVAGPAVRKPAVRKPAGGKPEAQKPAAQKPAAQKPAAPKPKGQTPEVETPEAGKPKE